MNQLKNTSDTGVRGGHLYVNLFCSKLTAYRNHIQRLTLGATAADKRLEAENAILVTHLQIFQTGVGVVIQLQYHTSQNNMFTAILNPLVLSTKEGGEIPVMKHLRIP